MDYLNAWIAGVAFSIVGVWIADILLHPNWPNSIVLGLTFGLAGAEVRKFLFRRWWR